MSIYFSSLNSGSNGNCYYIGNKNEALLIDAGISCRETEKRLARLGLGFEKIKAIFISHEHSDHISGLETIANKHRIRVYITEATHRNTQLNISPELLRNFTVSEPIFIGGLQVNAFKKQHDAIDPHSFTVKFNNAVVGVFTDIGISCHEVIKQFKTCHAAFLESNYDEQMLESGNYPSHLKTRIKGPTGHLSNKQALDLFTKHKSAHMSHILLAHLSKDNNNSDLVKTLFTKHAKKTMVSVASRFQETPLFSIDLKKQMMSSMELNSQLSLF